MVRRIEECTASKGLSGGLVASVHRAEDITTAREDFQVIHKTVGSHKVFVLNRPVTPKSSITPIRLTRNSNNPSSNSYPVVLIAVEATPKVTSGPGSTAQLLQCTLTRSHKTVHE